MSGSSKIPTPRPGWPGPQTPQTERTTLAQDSLLRSLHTNAGRTVTPQEPQESPRDPRREPQRSREGVASPRFADYDPLGSFQAPRSVTPQVAPQSQVSRPYAPIEPDLPPSKSFVQPTVQRAGAYPPLFDTPSLRPPVAEPRERFATQRQTPTLTPTGHERPLDRSLPTTGGVGGYDAEETPPSQRPRSHPRSLSFDPPQFEIPQAQRRGEPSVASPEQQPYAPQPTRRQVPEFRPTAPVSWPSHPQPDAFGAHTQSDPSAGWGREQQEYLPETESLDAPAQYAVDPQGRTTYETADLHAAEYPPAASDAAHYDFEDEPGADYEYDEAPPPPSRFPVWRVAGAAVSSVAVLFGVLIYGYMNFIGPATSGSPPVVKGDATPAKMKPDTADGKKFANTDSAVMKRIRDGSLAAPPSDDAPSENADEESEGTRRVKTFSVSRDGEIVPPAPPSSSELPQPVVAQQTPPPSTSGFPGMVLDTREPPPSAGEPETREVAEPRSADPVSEPKPKAKPPVRQEIAKVSPTDQEAKPAPRRATVIDEPSAEQKSDEPKSAEPKKTAVAKKPPATSPVTTGSTGTPSPTGGTAWMAVVASVPVTVTSRDQAMRQFADMQQKYGGVLQDKTFDVREADLGDKGKYHRLLIGPPGSKDAANTVCNGLKTAGFTGCWITSVGN